MTLFFRFVMLSITDFLDRAKKQKKTKNQENYNDNKKES